MANHPRLGEQITRLIRSLAAVQGWSMTAATTHLARQTVYSTDMIYRWRQGRGCPPTKTIEILAKIGREEANLDRDWGESFLKAASYPDTVDIINTLWGA